MLMAFLRLSEETNALDYLEKAAWVNPIEEGSDRNILDSLLTDIIAKGVLVSTKPEIILKIGTKRVLFETKDMDWGSDVKLYKTFEDFKQHFPNSLATGKKSLETVSG